jgi:hypothetical protein
MGKIGWGKDAKQMAKNINSMAKIEWNEIG